MDSILIFGGGTNQLTLIQSAKELGYRTIVIDPIEDAPAKQIADIFENVAPKNYERTKEIAIKYNVKGIVTCQMENPLLLMAKLAEELKFIFPTEKAILNARNKFLMKECFIKNGVPCAKGKLVRASEKITENICNEIGFPLIIKPLDSFSSRGVYKINKISEIENYLDNTKSFSSTGDVIIEEFMEGPEVSVESVTQNGITAVIQITDKIITPYPTVVEMAHIQPSALSKEIQTEITELVKKAIVALELDNCASHAEVKVTPKGIKMVELGARLGGDYITSHLVPLSTGVSIEKIAVSIAMGHTFELPPTRKQFSMIKWLDFSVGKKVKAIKGIELQSDLKENVVVFNVNLNENEEIPVITDSSKRKGYVIVKGSTRTEVMDTCLKAEKLILDLVDYF